MTHNQIHEQKIYRRMGVQTRPAVLFFGWIDKDINFYSYRI